MKKNAKILAFIVVVAIAGFLALNAVGIVNLSVSPDVAQAGKQVAIKSQVDADCYPLDGYLADWTVKNANNAVIKSYMGSVSGGQSWLYYTFPTKGTYWVQVYYYKNDADYVSKNVFCSQDVMMNIKDSVEPNQCSPFRSKRCNGKEVQVCDYAGTNAYLSWIDNTYCSGSQVCSQSGTDATCTTTPSPTDPCKSITCPAKCDTSVSPAALNINGYCEAGKCVYEKQSCTYGCEDAACVADDPVTPQCDPHLRPIAGVQNPWSECKDNLQHMISWVCVSGVWTQTTIYQKCSSFELTTEQLIIIAFAVAIVFLVVIALLVYKR